MRERNTRDKILKSALRLFVKYGFAGTSISDIAKDAGINQSLIYHHFQNKEDLWKKVKLHILENFTQEDLQIDAEKGLNHFLQQIVAFRFHFYDKNPEAIRLLGWQKLEFSRKKLAGGNTASPANWKPAIMRLQSKGQIRKNLDPDMVIHFIANAITGTFSDLFGHLENTPERKQHYLNMLIDCLERALG